eukprot:2111293-Rhodomonas_salina.1
MQRQPLVDLSNAAPRVRSVVQPKQPQASTCKRAIASRMAEDKTATSPHSSDQPGIKRQALSLKSRTQL